MFKKKVFISKKAFNIQCCIGVLLFLCFNSCSTEQSTQLVQQSPYRNIHDSIQYVGYKQCIGCHQEQYQGYLNNGMANSFGNATKSKSSADFSTHTVVFDSASNFYYSPEFIRDSLFITEFRLNSNLDTIYKMKKHIDYIIGSGRHTNSHMYSENSYLFQAPITFYTQEGIWDMAPGFESNNSRFGRAIQAECMSCHNGFAEFDQSSKNQFHFLPQGINCERCHGPGELHVSEKLAGNNIDTSTQIDYSIVHPGKLSSRLQMELCQRCHLQGVAVLNEGKDWYDFKPGTNLNEYMQVFLPEYQNSDGGFLMASHAERLKESNCFKLSEMSCVTCHNPHNEHVGTNSSSFFNQKCLSCHQENSNEFCSSLEIKTTKNPNCISCHMPETKGIDIPHVSITDHKIAIPSKQQSNAQFEFLKLNCLTDSTPDPITMARGYLKFFEAFQQNQQFIDSAFYYISNSEFNSPLYLETAIHYFYLNQNWNKIVDFYQPNLSTNAISWMRLSEAFIKLNNLEKALICSKQAIGIKPKDLEFQNKYAALLVQSNQLDKAKEVLEFILAEFNNDVKANANYGYLLAKELNPKAENFLLKAIALDPDYILAYANLIQYYSEIYHYDKAKELAKQLQNNQPNSKQTKQILSFVRSLN